MEEQLYGLLQTGIYAGAAMITALSAVGIYCAARFGTANTLARNEAAQARAANLEKALQNPQYRQILDRRHALAEKLLEEDSSRDSDELEAYLNAACGKLI